MAYDSAAVRTAGGSGTPATWTHTTVAASTTLLVAACLDGIATGASATCAATGLTFTQLGADVPCGTGGTTGFLRVWSAAGVAAGAHAVTVTCATADDISGGSIAYVTTGLGTPATNAGSANGTTSFITLPSSTLGNTVCAFTGVGNSTTATSSPATSRFVDNLSGSGGESGGNTAGADSPSTGSAVTVTWTNASTVSATFAVEIHAAAGGQPFILPQQLAGQARRRRKSSQIPQFNQQLPSVTIVPPGLNATASFPAPVVTSGPPCLVGVAGVPGAGWFTDQASNPKLWVATETWGILTNAGEWSGSTGGTWQQDITNFLTTRAGQGFTVCMTDPVWAASAEGARANGNTWDGVTPLAGGSADPTSAGLNATFWTRVDYLFSAAAAVGMTIGFCVCNVGDDIESGNWQDTWTTAQWQAWGALIGARYKGTPNLVWLVGNDMFSPYSDSQLNAVYTGVTGTGDTHMWSAWYNAECTARYATDTSTAEDWGVSYASFNFCYSYNAGYFVIEYAYGEVANEGAAQLLPVTWGDGYFYNGVSGGGYYDEWDRAERQEWWWCLTAGSRGVMGEAENVYQWSASACVTAVTGDWFFASNAKNIVTAFTALPEWWKLIPDLSSAFVTAGRGTRVTGYASGGSGGQYEPAFTNSWVTASITPDGNLAVCYLPNHTTITCTTSMLASGWAATWVDPISGASSSAGTGPTFNSTAKGTNSQGDPDWVLVFQAAAAPAALPNLVMAPPIPS